MTDEQLIGERKLNPVELAQQELTAFVQNPGLDRVAALFGATELPASESERLAALHAVATRHWNFRKGAERQATNWDDELDQLDSDQWSTIFAAADELGMVGNTEPVNKRPDFLVILGGAKRAPLDRLGYGLKKLKDFGQVAYLGASRPLTVAEKQASEDYAPGAETEFDLGCGAIETLLDAELKDNYQAKRGDDMWQVRLYEFADGGVTRQAFALSTLNVVEGRTRATTYGNYAFFADVAELRSDPNQTVVAVTTGLYVPSQHLRGVRELTLQCGTHFETIGHSAEYSGATRKPRQLLQEIKAAVDAAARLELAIAISNQG